VVRVANSFIFKEPVFNYSSDFPFLWDELLIPVRYGSNYTLAREEFQRVLDDITSELARQLKADWRSMTDKYMLENARLEPAVSLTMKENWVEFALRYVVDYKLRRSTKDQICVALLAVIEGSKGDIKLGAPSLEISSVPSVDIHLTQMNANT
jgi:small-conductance mechanosensitive channel